MGIVLQIFKANRDVHLIMLVKTLIWKPKPILTTLIVVVIVIIIIIIIVIVITNNNKYIKWNYNSNQENSRKS